MSSVTRFFLASIAIVLALIVLVDASSNTHNVAGHRVTRAKRALEKRKETYSGDATWFSKYSLQKVFF
jgi:hypothetical protein